MEHGNKPDEKGFYGQFGGAYVPEILYKCVTDLQQAYLPIIESKEFQDEYRALLRDYVGRPSPLYHARRLSNKYGCTIYLKREDLNHTGAHKINNTIGQILMAQKMGKTRIIAETGAGRGDSHRLCTHGNGLRDIYGQDRRRTTAHQCGAHEDARRKSTPCHHW